MLRSKKNPSSTPIETTQSFRQSLLSSLSKLSNNSTLKTGLDEIRELLINHMKDNERLMIVLNSLSEIHQLHQKPSTRKEYIKVYGLIAEIYEDKILEIFPKIIMSLNKRLKEGDNQLNQAISETMGQLIEHIFKHVDPQEALKPLSSAIFLFFENFSHDQKNTQIGSAMCVSRIIQTSPVNCLEFLMAKIVNKIRDAFLSGYCKSQTQLLESLLSLILGVEEKFQEHLDDTLPMVLDSMLNTDWNVRKIANDIIYTLCVLIPDGVVRHKEDIIKQLNNCRFDKIKHVRDAAAMAINIVKEIKGIEWEDKGEDNDDVMDEDDNTFAEHYQKKEINFNNNDNNLMKNSFSKENSAKKKNLKKTGILNRPINPEFLKNAVHKTDGIEIKTNQPLLQINQNNSNSRKTFDKEYYTDREEVTLIDSRKKQQEKIGTPQKVMVHVSSDTEFIKKSVRNSPILNKSPILNENSRGNAINSKEYIEIMEKMNQIFMQQNMLFEKYNYIENDLKSQLKSTTTRLDLLEAMFSNSVRAPPMTHLLEQRPYYVNYQVPYPSQMPLNDQHTNTGLYLKNPTNTLDPNLYLQQQQPLKPNNFMSFGPNKLNTEKPHVFEKVEENDYDFLSRNKSHYTDNNYNNKPPYNEIIYNKSPYNEMINNKPVNLSNNERFQMNTEPMKLEAIMNNNYQVYSPSKKPAVYDDKNQLLMKDDEVYLKEENNSNNFDFESHIQKTPKKP